MLAESLTKRRPPAMGKSSPELLRLTRNYDEPPTSPKLTFSTAAAAHTPSARTTLYQLTQPLIRAIFAPSADDE